MRHRLGWVLIASLTVLASCAGSAADGCGTCTSSPTAICDQGVCKPRLPERPDPHIETERHEVAALPYVNVAAWPTRNAAASAFVQNLLTGAGIPHRESGIREWQELGVPQPLAPRARRLLGGGIEAGQPGRLATDGIPTDSPAHLAFKVLAD